jgi:hypothetical protein
MAKDNGKMKQVFAIQCAGDILGMENKRAPPERPIIQEDSPGTQKGYRKVIKDEKKPPPKQAME